MTWLLHLYVTESVGTLHWALFVDTNCTFLALHPTQYCLGKRNTANLSLFAMQIYMYRSMSHTANHIRDYIF